MVTVTIWSEIHCPWATVAVHRLRAARDAADLDVVFDQRAWPLELVNERGTPRQGITTEAAVLANHEPDLFSAYRNDSWPSTFLPAFELVAATRRLLGLRGAEDVDYALRVAFFRHSVDVSIEAGLRRALSLTAESAALDADAIIALWRDDNVRADVFADFERSKELPITASPQVFWADGSTTHNPGLRDHTMVRGIPRINSDDRDEPKRLLLETTSRASNDSSVVARR
jgi:predicted DsbA family dithiol-disulfide isomerase